MIFNLLNLDIYISQFRVAQDDIFAGFNALDDLWWEDDPPNFADEYKKYMSTLYETNVASAKDKATAISNSLKLNAVTEDKGTKNKYATAIENLEKTDPPSNLAMPTERYLNFPESTYSIKKREVACATTRPPPKATDPPGGVTGLTTAPPLAPSASPLACAPPNGPRVKQSDLSDTVLSYCASLSSSGVHVTKNGINSGPYNRGGTANYVVTLVSGSYKLTQDNCKTVFERIINGCAPFSAPDPKDFWKYGCSVIHDADGGNANFSMPIIAPTAIGRRESRVGVLES